MKLEWPQITYLLLILLTLMIDSYKHKKPKTGFYDIWITIPAVLISLYIHYAGGFFSK
jgi:hypothetical protein